MALDGMFLYKLARELSAELEDSRIEKIYQPSKDELIFVMRTRNGAKKLYMSCRPDSARVHITGRDYAYPNKPPMLCMLLRKRFLSARFVSLEQDSFERVLTFNFIGSNELGDKEELKIIAEIMGRYSNIVFTDKNGVIIDSVKRVGASKSSVREILPGRKYLPPPQQDKLSVFGSDVSEILARIFENRDIMLTKAILKTVKGISPLLCNELAFISYGGDRPVYEASGDGEKLAREIEKLKNDLSLKTQGCIVSTEKPIEFSFADILQFGSACRKDYYNNLSALLDDYYVEKFKKIKSEQLGGELFRVIDSNIEKLRKKVLLQSGELEESRNNERLKLFGELINANLFSLSEGVSKYNLLNYYTGEEIEIPADILLSPSENSQRYYKEYRKAETAKTVLAEQIKKAEAEIDFLESERELLTRALAPEEVNALRNELTNSGYIKKKRTKKEKAPKELKPFEFITDGGFSVLVGRNNINNNKLTFKIASGGDIWFHTKNIHGSHTVLIKGGREADENDLKQAAEICAYHSKARASSGVAVDYTAIKNVKRIKDAMPGKVTYTDYKTVYVTPDESEIEKLRVKE